MNRLQVTKSSFTTPVGRPLLLAVGLSGALALGAQAQGQPGKGKARGTIQDAEIEVVKDRVNTLPEATRNFEKIRLAPPPKATRPVTYTYPDFRLPVTRLSPSVQVLTVAQEELEPLIGNYLKLGFGNYGSVYGRAHLHSVRNEQYSYGLDVRHNSSATGPVDGKNSGASQTSAALTGEYYLGATALGASLDYAHDVYHFYGYEQNPLVLPIPTADAIRQTFNRIGLRGYARNRAPDAQLQYEVGVGYKYWKDDYTSSESNFLIDAKAGYALNETSRITIQADGSFISEKASLNLPGAPYDANNRTRNFFQATPAYELTGKTGLSLILGATIGYSSEVQAGFGNPGSNPGGVGTGAVYPAVRVSYAIIPEKFQLYGGLGGAIQRVTRYDLTQENPWLDARASQAVADTHYGPTAYVGFTAAPSNGLSLAVRATYGRTRNLYFYNTTRAYNPSSRYELVYDSSAVNILTLHGDLSYNAGEKVRVGIKADYNHYGVHSLSHPYGRPPLISTIYSTYNAFDKLLLGASIYYYSPNYSTSYTTVSNQVSTYFQIEDRQTNSVIDLSLRADYRLTPKFSIFALGNNLTNRHYQRYLNYQSQGINVIGGLTYSF